ncbi:unconventional myosin-XIX isoform X1 [Vombatus ursinus]|uniref:Unconventional myosin-XIX n=1 Tax=Vombatus ursinus TaxID=29139 RepID=A0A4X2L2B2_VOMUR|nr:unconventional myosin-XIX isoform X1 [Vombatus ursinus]XP_027726179.1 unconventional myosin-XIX isoform X1 [Vombatus ursinus]XP_027726180.1 unconventional myosin-XIX isoform X1 [Vombatus ursinus]
MLQQVNGQETSSLPYGNDPLSKDLQVFLGSDFQLAELDDLTKVNPVTPATVLKCLQERYQVDVFYTNAGCTLVALNPFKPVPYLYCPELMRDYHTTPQLQKLKPHIFTVGEQSYRNVKSLLEPVDQSIIVSGESGAGKTWTSRCLMKFYATVANSSASQETHKTVERIEKRVLDSNPVMEAFGNACTLRNSNSSRFGKYIQLQLNRAQQMTGASVQTYLLEKTRVAYQAPLERNFHIFYQITKGASSSERLEWHLPEGATFHWLPNSERTLEEDCFEVTKDAMLHLGIDHSTQNNIFKILSGLLHLGNIHFDDSEDESQVCQPQEDAKCFVTTTASLLRIPKEELLETLRVRTITAGKQQQVFRKPCCRADCETRRDCLAKVTYARLFDWLVSVINGSICAEPSTWTTFIGLLDVYGFECFPNNNLEQLCINYANEKLQQHFVAHYLRAQQEEYAAEGLEWSFISYQDNQSCLDLIEGSPVSIFSLINEECRLNRPSNATQLQTRIESTLSSNASLSRNKFSKDTNFIIAHYAGPVQYQIEGMVEKNKDPVPPELTRLLQHSQDSLLQKLFPSQEKEPNDLSGQSRAPVVTVVSKFKSSLEQLMQVLHSTTPHYIRCIKPNSHGHAQRFQAEEVLSQLEACGIVETVHISAAGFPIRVSFQSFLERYDLLRKSHPPQPRPSSRLPSSSPTKEHSGQQATPEKDTVLHALIRDILLTLPPTAATVRDHPEAMLAPRPVHCGRTKVFMTDSVLELLEHCRMQILNKCARCIQFCWRRHQRRKLEKQRWAATLLQAVTRSWLTRKRIQRLHAAATSIKHAWRKWRAKMDSLVFTELDDVEENCFAKVPCSPLSTTLPWPPRETIQLWPLGLVLSNAPAGVIGMRRNLSLQACLQIPCHSSTYKVEATQCDQAGITSIRALPQGSIRFHCKKSPLLYANISPEPQNYDITGFNQILLDRHRLIPV